jgi:glyoxylate reductase
MPLAALLIGEITHARPEWEQLASTLTLKVTPHNTQPRQTEKY